MGWQRSGRWVIASITCLALGLSGCSSTDGDAQDQPTTTALATTTSTSVAPAAEASEDAVAAYEAMWGAMTVVSATGDYQSPLLAEHADGDALRRLVEGVYVSQRDGIVAKGEPRTNPRAVGAQPEHDPTVVAIEDCIDSRNWLQYRTTGELVDDEPGGFRFTTAQVSLVDGRWKVVELLVGRIGTC